MILVGTKSDVRGDRQAVSALEAQGKHMVSKEEANARAREIGSLKYMECSAMTQDGLKEVFDEAVRAAVDHKNKVIARPCCIIL